MNANQKNRLAADIFGSPKVDALQRVSATAVTDSADGLVTIEFDDGSQIEVDTLGAIESGDTVLVDVQNGHTVVSGATGWGDRLYEGVDGLQTLVHEYSGGVLVAKVGQTAGALVNADGSFDVVELSWSGTTPTIGERRSYFGDYILLGNTAGLSTYIARGALVVTDSSGDPVFSVYGGAASDIVQLANGEIMFDASYSHYIAQSETRIGAWVDPVDGEKIFVEYDADALNTPYLEVFDSGWHTPLPSTDDRWIAASEYVTYDTAVTYAVDTAIAGSLSRCYIDLSCVNSRYLPWRIRATRKTQGSTIIYGSQLLENYTLPTASASTLGGIKVGSGLSIDSGALSVDTSEIAQQSDIADMLTDSSPLFKIVNVSFTTASLAVNNGVSGSMSIASSVPSGYTAIGIVGTQSNHGQNWHSNDYINVSTQTLNYNIKHAFGSGSETCTLTWKLLCVPSTNYS